MNKEEKLQKQREANHRYYANNTKKARARAKYYRELNPDYQREWRKNNPAKESEYNKKYSQKETVKEYRRQYSENYRQEHPEWLRKYNQQYYLIPKNKVKIIARSTEQVYRKRAMLNNVEREKYTKIEIYKRDNEACGICSQTININLKFPDPFSFSFHHVKPISLGGNDKKENITSAHLRCNQSIGNRV